MGFVRVGDGLREARSLQEVYGGLLGFVRPLRESPKFCHEHKICPSL